MVWHRPVRPGWLCEVDGFEWPCAAAKRWLLGEVVDPEDTTDLQYGLVSLMVMAEGELADVTVAELYHRFVAWAMARYEVCRVCESRGHSVLPVLPPRIVPCRKVHAVMAGHPLAGLLTPAGGAGEEPDGDPDVDF
jgi:hypothetical protein